MVKAEPKKAEGSGLPLGHEGKGGLMSLLYPYDSPWSNRLQLLEGVLGNFWHLMQMEVIPVVSQGRCSVEVLKSGTEIETRGQHTGKTATGSRQIEIQGSAASMDPVFINCWASCIDIVVVPMGWQTCRRNEWNYKTAQPVRTLTCQEGYLPHRRLLQGFHA